MVKHAAFFEDLYERYADLPMPKLFQQKNNSTSNENNIMTAAAAAAAGTSSEEGLLLEKIAEEGEEAAAGAGAGAQTDTCMSFQSFLQALADYHIFPGLINFSDAQQLYYDASCIILLDSQEAADTPTNSSPDMLQVKDAPIVKESSRSKSIAGKSQAKSIGGKSGKSSSKSSSNLPAASSSAMSSSGNSSSLTGNTAAAAGGLLAAAKSSNSAAKKQTSTSSSKKSSNPKLPPPTMPLSDFSWLSLEGNGNGKKKLTRLQKGGYELLKGLGDYLSERSLEVAEFFKPLAENLAANNSKENAGGLSKPAISLGSITAQQLFSTLPLIFKDAPVPQTITDKQSFQVICQQLFSADAEKNFQINLLELHVGVGRVRDCLRQQRWGGFAVRDQKVILLNHWTLLKFKK
mgnify:CR=1 FL=1